MKKILEMMMVVSLTAGVLAGCAQGSPQQEGKAGVKTVTVWTENTHSKVSMESWVKQYNETEGKEKGVCIDYQVKDSSYLEVLRLALQNGNAPDLFAGEVVENVKNGYITALDDLQGGKELLAHYSAADLSYRMRYGEKTYSLPVSIMTQGLIYNKDMFIAAGLVDEKGDPKPPRTFAQLREYAKVLTDKKNKKYGIILPMKWTGWFGSDIGNPMMASVGNRGFNPATGQFDYTSMADIMDTFLKIKADGSYFPGEEGLDNDQARAQFSAGNVAMKISYSFDVGVLNDQFATKHDFGVAPLPVLDETKAYKQLADIGPTYLINKSSAAKLGDAALIEAMRFLTCDKSLRYYYEQGTELPYKWDVVSDMQLQNPKKGWVEFAQIAQYSTQYPQEPQVDMGANELISKRFVSEVWSGKTTPQALTADYTEVMNKALDQYFVTHPEDKRGNYMVENYESKINR